MNREEVDRFLAEADDVIADWDGGPDSASWAADGTHEEREIRGHYGDIRSSSPPTQDVSRARGRPSPDSRGMSWRGYLSQEEADRLAAYLPRDLQPWQEVAIRAYFGSSRDGSSREYCNCRAVGPDLCERHGNPATRHWAEHGVGLIEWDERGRPNMPLPPLGFIHSHFTALTPDAVDDLIADAYSGGLTAAWNCTEPIRWNARALEAGDPVMINRFTHAFRLMRVSNGREYYWALIDQLGFALAGRRYYPFGSGERPQGTRRARRAPRII